MTSAGSMTPSGPTDIVAHVSNIRVDRAHRLILDNVTLELRAGTVTLLAGPNGAGKTTLIRALSGSIVPTSGQVSVVGYAPSRDRRARAALGLVPQEIALYSRLSVRENIEIFAAFSGGRATPALVDHCVARTGLASVADALVSTLSGGFQRRANIACALVGRPRLLLLDEPLVGLDPLARRAICADLKSLARTDNVALLLATHDLDDGEAIADTVVILRAGRIAAQASPADLVTAQFAAETSRTEVLLMDQPDDAARSALMTRGYVPTAEATVWRGIHRAAEGPVSLETADLGLPMAQIRELRQRRFRLGDAYEAIVGPGGAS